MLRAPMAQEQQEYIQTKVNPTLENLVTQVLLERPDNPVPFMLKWLAEHTQQAGGSPVQLGLGEADKLRSEVKALQEEVRELEAKLSRRGRAKAEAPQPAGMGAVTKEDSEEEDDDDEHVEADVVQLAPPKMYLQRGPRASVSAEAYGVWNKMKAYTPPVVPKSQEQRHNLLAVLQQSFLFSALDSENLDIIVGAMAETKVEAGERIIQEGDSGDVMFVIEKGSFRCLKMIDGTEVVVKQCAVGDVFGELALLYNCPRAASVEAEETSTAWQLGRDTFNHIVRDASIRKREMYEEFLANVPILEPLIKYERLQLADALQPELLTAGTTVIRQGEEGTRFYLVEAGELVVMKAEGGETAKEVHSYKRGDYFGELALLQDEVRKATVIARTNVKLLYVDRKTFDRLLGSLKDVMKNNATQYR